MVARTVLEKGINEACICLGSRVQSLRDRTNATLRCLDLCSRWCWEKQGTERRPRPQTLNPKP